MGKVLVVGLGVSGKSAAQFLLRRGEEVFGYDTRHIEIEGVQRVTKEVDSNQFDYLVLSPGIPITHPICHNAKEIIGEVELACRYLKNPCIGVTGTNGKTTVTSLVAHVLNNSGIAALPIGNIGTPLTSVVDQCTDEILVLELSSYQLETMRSQVLDVAAILNITPDHLDRYPDFASYAAAKLHIADCLKRNAPLYIESELKKYGLEKAIPYFGVDFNQENERVAFLLISHFGVSEEQFFHALKSFQKPPHRLEFIQEIDQIAYYNDSKGTNIDSVIRAVDFLPRPVLLIAGGVDKGASYKPWVSAFKNKVRAIFTIGEASKKIQTELEENYTIIACESLQNALNKATLYAKKGDAVLLSPGCSSFDMFKNYEERGNVFKRLVHEKGEKNEHQ